MYNHLLKLGWFADHRLSPINSVYTASFEEAVRLLSYHIALET